MTYKVLRTIAFLLTASLLVQGATLFLVFDIAGDNAAIRGLERLAKEFNTESQP